MPTVLKRILVNGLLTAAVLGLIGYGFAELASLWLVAKAPVRMTPGAPVAEMTAEEPVGESLKYRVPAMMAFWGFAFVASGEGLLYWWRGNRPAPLPPVKKPDLAEALLEQILAEVEASRAATTETAPFPATSLAENNPVVEEAA